jgi:hypothetical protein
VAVVILHVHKYEKKVTRKFKSEGLHERHVVATWKLGNHLSSLADFNRLQMDRRTVRVCIHGVYFCFVTAYKNRAMSTYGGA